MTKFTKEEISLCKQVACRHRKEIVRGDRYVHIGDKRNEAILSLGRESLTFRNLIPLWTISDCLEWLKEKKLNIFIEWDNSKKRWWIGLGYGDAMPHLSFEGKTPSKPA